MSTVQTFTSKSVGNPERFLQEYREDSKKFEVLIVRNASIPSLFDVVIADFVREKVQVLECNLTFEAACDEQAKYENLLDYAETYDLEYQGLIN